MKSTTVVLVLQLLACGALLTSAAGCATRLTEDGEKVEMVYVSPTEVASRWQPLGILTCQKEQNLASVESNKKSCENDLRNRAADKGADLLVIESFDTFPGTATIGVSLIGHIYRR